MERAVATVVPPMSLASLTSAPPSASGNGVHAVSSCHVTPVPPHAVTSGNPEPDQS
jgi:hypothetical protein